MGVSQTTRDRGVANGGGQSPPWYKVSTMGDTEITVPRIYSDYEYTKKTREKPCPPVSQVNENIISRL